MGDENMFIEFVLDTISLFVFLGLLIWGFIFGMKIYVKKKKNKELINFSRKVELTFNKFIKSLWRIFNSLLTMGICALLAIGMKPLIYKLNSPLGWGYASFASYIIAILLWIIIRREKI